MNFGEQPRDKEQKAERVEIKDTASFQEAITAGNLEQAEAWLDNIKTTRPENYDDRWIDHRERELFKAYCATEDWKEAKRIVKSSINQTSKEGRKERLEQLSSQSYDSI